MNPVRKSRSSAVRNHELEKRLSKSGIPKPLRNISADRISGVRLLDSHSAVKAVRRISRSAESARNTIATYQRPRGDSVQRSGSSFRPRSAISSNWETPNSRLPPDYLQTPMSALSINSYRHSSVRTPSCERNESPLHMLKQALCAVPIKDKRMVTKGEWQQATASRIVAKLREDSCISSCLSGSQAPLKPITIKLFLDVTNYLLSKFGGTRFQVNNTNYIEKLPIVARKLLYPGVMAKSWLKSVNTMHTYQHVLAFLSYLVDLAEVKDTIALNMDMNRLYGTDEKGQLLALRHQYYFKAWKMFQEDEEDFESIVDKYLCEFKKLQNFSEEEFAEHEKEFLDLKNNKNKLMMRMEDVKSRVEKGDSDLASIKDKTASLDRRFHKLNSQITELKENQDERKRVLNKAVNDTKELGVEIKRIEHNLTTINMTANERDKNLHQIKLSQEIINSKENLLRELSKIVFSKDISLANTQNKALNLSIAFNVKVANVGVIAGRSFTSYSIMERELLTPGPIDTIQKTNEELKELIVQAESELQEIMDREDHKKINQCQLNTQIKVLKDHTVTLKNTQETLENSIKEKQSHIAMLNKKREHAQINVNNAMNLKSKEQTSLHELKEQLDDWKDQNSKWRKKIDQLISEESSVHESCKKRAEMLILEYLAIANTVFDKKNAV